MTLKFAAYILASTLGLVTSFAVAKTLWDRSLMEQGAEGSMQVAPGSRSADDAPVQVAQSQPADTSATTTTTTTTHGGWTVACSEAGDPPVRTCSAEFRVVSGEGKAIVLIWLIGRDKQGKLLSEFVTPSDVRILPGVAVTLDDAKPMQAQYISCTTRQGCRASMELTPKILRDLQAASKAKIGITLLNEKVMDVQFDIPGIDKVLAVLGAG